MSDSSPTPPPGRAIATGHAGWSIRSARPEDYPHFLALFPALGVPEAPPSEAVWQAGYMARALFLEVCDGSRDDGQVAPVGYAFYDALPGCGYVRNIMVADGHRRRGYGRALMNALADIFRAAGCDEWRLNVMRDNRAAIGLYESCGLHVAYPTSVVHVPFALAGAPAATELRVSPLPREGDGAVERLFAMPAGLLTSLRQRPGAHLLQLLDESRSPSLCLGVTRLSPDMPGGFPFRVSRPELVGPMLTAMRALVSTEFDAITLTCEDDPALVEYLCQRGAEVRLQIFHMRGELP